MFISGHMTFDQSLSNCTFNITFGSKWLLQKVLFCIEAFMLCVCFCFFEHNCTPSWKKTLVTYMSPVEAFATGVKIFDWQKVCLITWSSLLSSWLLDFYRKVKLQPSILDTLIFTVRRWPWPLDRISKGLWSLDSILIMVANASTQDI